LNATAFLIACPVSSFDFGFGAGAARFALLPVEAIGTRSWYAVMAQRFARHCPGLRECSSHQVVQLVGPTVALAVLGLHVPCPVRGRAILEATWA